MGGSSPTHPPATFCASRSSPPARGRGQPVLWDTCALQTPNATPKKHKPKSRRVSEEPQGSLGLSVLHPSPGAPGTLAMPGPGPTQRGAPRHGGAASSRVLGCCQQQGHHPTTWQQGAAAPQTRRGPARAGRQRPNPPRAPLPRGPRPLPGAAAPSPAPLPLRAAPGRALPSPPEPPPPGWAPPGRQPRRWWRWRRRGRARCEGDTQRQRYGGPGACSGEGGQGGGPQVRGRGDPALSLLQVQCEQPVRFVLKESHLRTCLQDCFVFGHYG